MFSLLDTTWGANETTFHLSERWKFFIKDASDNFDNTGKKSFSYIKEWTQKSKKFSWRGGRNFSDPIRKMPKMEALSDADPSVH